MAKLAIQSEDFDVRLQIMVLLIGSVCLMVFPICLTAAEPSDNQPFTHSPDLFPILPWDVLHGWKEPYRNPKHGLQSIAECNFTLAGFVTPEDLPLCEQLGLAAIMAPARSNLGLASGER